MTLPELLAVAEPLESGFRLALPPGWMQGRTAYGGFSACLALSAAMRAGGEGLPPLRSATVNFVGPLAGEVTVTARVLRRGRNAIWIDAEITRDGQVGLTAGFVFMGPVASALHLDDCPLPIGLIAPEAALPYQPHPLMPVFLGNHFEVRFALPRDGVKRPELCWWVKLREREGLDPIREVMLVADCLPPGVMPLLGAGVPVSSMTWLANLLSAAPQTRDGWWLLRSAGDFAEAGCSSQRMAIWNADGAPIMAGMQSVAVFG